jgi:DNA polymerase II large subunit
MEQFESEEMKKYFEGISSKVLEEFGIATDARKKGFDPEEKVDSHLAESMVDRVEGLISAVAPQLIGSGVTKRMFELEKTYGVLDWRVALVIAEEVAKEKFCRFKDKKEAIEVGIRTGFAYHTLGIVAAPLEGFIGVEVQKRRDGGEYLSVKFAGPVRGAGGTGASVCVLIADYVRKKMGYGAYDPDESEVNRFVAELNDYHERVTNLQYHPSEDEIKFLASRIPVEIGGDPTEKIDVSNYKDLPRVNTNKIRGGLCLVMSMIALKAPKLWMRLEKWGCDFDMDWSFMAEFLELQKKKKAGSDEKQGEKPKISPNKTFIADLVAGRPVLTHPMAFGGFRLRYGRCRTSGFSAAAIHPAVMHLLNNYIAAGTQLKLERPGKAASITSCDYIEGPVVLLKSGEVLKITSEGLALRHKKEISKILFLGDILINYGDFSENGHSLVPAGYCEEWWVKELEKSVVTLFGSLDAEKAVALVSMSFESFDSILKNPLKVFPSPENALQISEKFSIPLHPYYTLYWKALSKADILALIDILESSNVEADEKGIKKLIIRNSPEIKLMLEKIALPHILAGNEFIVVGSEFAGIFMKCLGVDMLQFESALKTASSCPSSCALDVVNSLSKVKIMDKAGIFIGARMGRPEKAKMRKLTGSPHVLFPVGDEGDRLRCFQSALEAGKINGNFPVFFCRHCGKETIFSVCEVCGKKSVKKFYCRSCGVIDSESCQHGHAQPYRQLDLDIRHYFSACLEKLNTKVYPDLVKGVRGTSNKGHIPEHLVKGILRAKHDICVNKDGSVRFDMTELPITHFKPAEIQASVEKLRALGYAKDIFGNALSEKEQILEIKPQDIILPAGRESADEPATEVLLRVGAFVDELLEKLYGLKKYYNFKSKDDLIGVLVLGLAPHISAGMIGRIIGFSNASACFAHPLWHAALRRDCDGDEASVSLLLDSLINFSRQYLPDRIGGRTMDAPLVFTPKIVPSEVDDMVQGMDIVWNYPLEFYEAALQFKNPKEVSIEQIKKRVGSWRQYEQMGFTHSVSSINQGVLCSAYKILPSMQEKLDGQMDIAGKVSAVDARDVARLIIEKHFIKDIKGNLRKFSTQQFRCVKCNVKYRRPPLLGRCTACGGKILFTISEGSVTKYLAPAMKLARDYKLDAYLSQSLVLTQKRIDEVFGREKEKQEGLKKFFG